MKNISGTESYGKLLNYIKHITNIFNYINDKIEMNNNKNNF